MKGYRKYLHEIIFLTGKDLKKIPLMVFFFLISSFLDLAGIGLVAPYVALLLSPDRFKSSPFIIEYIPWIDSLSRVDLISSIGALLVLCFFTKAVVGLTVNRMILRFSYEKAVDIRRGLMRNFQGITYTNFLKKSTSEYIYSIQSLSAIFAQGTFQSVLRLISEGIIILGVFILLLAKSGLPLIILAAVVISATISYDFLFRRKVSLYGRMADDQTKTMIQGIVETVEGVKEVRILGKEEFFYKKVIKSAKQLSDVNISISTIKVIPRYLIELIVVFFIVALIYITLATDGNIIGMTSTLTMFAAAAMRLVPSFNQVLGSFSQLVQNRNAVGLLYNDLSFPVGDSFDVKRLDLQKEDEFRTASLKNISYRYENASREALRSINLNISAGSSIGLIGTSGSGKTTLVNLILGLLPPEHGTLQFNEREVNKENLCEWMRHIAYIPQDIFLVNDSLRRNIALGSMDSEIDEARVIDSIKKSNLQGLLEELPDGLNTPLGERGIRLSGGQRQRVAIARAFYHDRSVLVMDEATSALDNVTENEIVEEIRSLKGQKTLIVIAHRLSTLKHCDIIYRMENGAIVESGSYEEVIAKC